MFIVNILWRNQNTNLILSYFCICSLLCSMTKVSVNKNDGFTQKGFVFLNFAKTETPALEIQCIRFLVESCLLGPWLVLSAVCSERLIGWPKMARHYPPEKRLCSLFQYGNFSPTWHLRLVEQNCRLQKLHGFYICCSTVNFLRILIYMLWNWMLWNWLRT